AGQEAGVLHVDPLGLLADQELEDLVADAARHVDAGQRLQAVDALLWHPNLKDLLETEVFFRSNGTALFRAHVCSFAWGSPEAGDDLIDERLAGGRRQ